MATWVCSTKKFLSSAITSIAGELEQTVLDFNDAIHNLSNKQEAARVHGAPSEIHPHSTVVEHPPQAARVHKAPSEIQPHSAVLEHPPQAARVHKAPSEIHPHSAVVEHPPPAKPLTNKSDVVLALDPQQCETSLPHLQESETSLPHLQESETVSDLQESETCPPHLQESETYFQLPAVTTKQPQTIGFAPILNARLSRSSPSLFPEDASWERKSESSDRSSPLDSIYSASSPCLYQQTHTQTQTHTQGCLQTRRLFYRENPNFSQTINLPGPEVISRGDTLEFQGSKPGRFGRSRVVCQKRPGRVVRTSAADEQQTIEGEQTSDSSSDVTDRQCVLVNAPTHVSIERDPHPLRWMTLGPLSRVLSFAFSQLANIILMLSDDQQTYDRPPSRQLTYDRPPSRQMTLTYDTPRQQTTPDLQTREGHFQTICDVISPDSSIIRSTYSCESFEIIDPCDPCDPCSHEPCSHDPCSHDPMRVRLTPPPGERSFLSRLYHGNHDNTDSLSVSAFVSINPGLTSSAEFVNFNFKELILNRHFNTLNPVLAADVKQPPDVIQSDVSADSPALTQAGADDDGDDDSTSFSIISDNDNEEFIVV